MSFKISATYRQPMLMALAFIHPLSALLIKRCLNSKGKTFVFALESLLNDCECSKPSSYAISEMERFVHDNFSLAFSIIAF